MLSVDLHALHLDALLLKRYQLKTQLAAVGDMRPGSLVPRFRRCGKPSCHCAKQGAQGHGPSYSLTHAVSGQTVTHVIPAGETVDKTRAQLNEYHRFRNLGQQLLAVSEQICDLQTKQAEAQPVKKTARGGLLVAEILWDMEALLGRQSLHELDLEALENAVRRQVLKLAGRAVEQRLNAHHSDAELTHARCQCGPLARYVGRRPKTFASMLGPRQLNRAYFHCAACGHGFRPRDRQWGRRDTS